MDLLQQEMVLWEKGCRLVAGVDEAGRGPICGPVVAAACILPQDILVGLINDSKRLSEKKRDELYERIRNEAVAVGVGIVDNAEIDRINILQATFKAMKLALADLGCSPDYVLVDGNQMIPGVQNQETMVKGDSRSASIAAASIIAKVTRDRIMQDLDVQYPGYGLARHKGYPSAGHYQALRELGPTPAHRLSFNGVLQGK